MATNDGGEAHGAESTASGQSPRSAPGSLPVVREWAVLGLLVPLLIDVHSAPATTPEAGASVSPPGAAAHPSLASSASPASFYTVTPCRLVDTRTPAGPVGGPALAANATRTFPVFGLCGVPSSATVVAVNVTAVDETGSGHLQVFAAGSAPPDTSTINFVAGTTRANNAVVSLGIGGQISVLCRMATGRTHVVLDVTGFFAPGPVRPVVTTSDTGTMLVLQTETPTEIVRVGLLKSWGGAITEVSLNGTDYVNDDDPGRQIQTSLWDGSGNYVTSWGYNPVESGDHFFNGSPLLASTLGPDSIYTRTQPLQWAPENFGGGWANPVLGDAYIEKRISVVPGFNRVFKVHYKITHFGSDAHSTAGQEAPVMYVNPNVPRFLYYEGSAPWTNGALSQHTMPFACCDSLHTPERWGAYVDGTDTGIALYTPGQYPNSKGFNAGSTLQFTPLSPFTWDPGAVLEFDTFILVGAVTESRAAIYALQSQQSGPSPFSAVGYLDVPASGDILGGRATVAGWAWAITGVVSVDVFVDGNRVGAATYGGSRPDIPIAFPGAPSNAAYQYSLDTTAFPNGSHTVVAKVTDGAGRVATFVTKQVAFSN
jgi:Big-like domain-containing protein